MKLRSWYVIYKDPQTKQMKRVAPLTGDQAQQLLETYAAEGIDADIGTFKK